MDAKLGKIRVYSKCPINNRIASCGVHQRIGEKKSGSESIHRIISQFGCANGILLAFCNVIVFEPTSVSSLNITLQSYAIRRCKIGVEHNRSPSKPQSIFISLRG